MKSPVSTPRRLAPALLLLAASFVVLTVVQFRPDPRVGAVAAVFMPGTSGRDALLKVVQAGGEAVRTGRADFIIIARPQDGESFDTLKQRLAVSGALLVINPLALAGCLGEDETRPGYAA
ncbi:hypothetical protein [Radicibacter daui]|uniref:hypothetical protein n=1 Tax=Radicibacter daui TaxID=3064829 RepID=UPI004046C67A